MLRAPTLAGRRYVVYGLARTGLSAVRFLGANGAAVLAWDDAPAPRAALAAQIDTVAGSAEIVIGDPMEADLAGFAGLVVSPGVPLNRHPLAARARAAGVAILGDIELFQFARAWLPPHRVVGVTGTNGKSTTTALIHHLLERAGIPARLGGNIGLPILDQPPLDAGGVYVLELSSYQIDLTHHLACDIAVFTNLTPDHLDRHGGMAGYAAAKERLFAMLQPGAAAVIATDDPFTRGAARRLPEGVRLIAVSGRDVAPGDQQRWPALAGPHNAQNVACAVAVARALGAPDDRIEAGLRDFPGLAHRMQTVAIRHGVRFVNDSKATNPASVAPALQAYPRVHWILGGVAKGADLDACIPHLGHVKAAYLIGEAETLFALLLAPHVPIRHCATLARAVADAAAAAAPGDTVLLSPACASFDQFRDFEDRGRAFEAAVAALDQ